MLNKNSEIEKNQGLLVSAMSCWGDMAAFRRDRDRCKRFTYGDQWGDRMDLDGENVSEEEFIRRQGNVPLKNNLIRRLVRNVLGVFRNNWEIPQCVARDLSEMPEGVTMQKLLEYNMELNHMEEVYCRTMEEFLISGLAVHRKWFGVRGGHADCWTDIVQPDNFFCDSGSRDFRGWDVSMIGEIHDMDFQTMCAQFARNRDDVESLKRIYGVSGDLAGERNCRIVEVWRKEIRERYRCHDLKNGRFFMSDAPVRREGLRSEWVNEEGWYGYFLAPGGEVLSSGASPYAHGKHPFVFKAYPYIDGEIHSFVSDVIDQQKFTNRLISMYDWILRASAKGVLLFPEGSLPEGVDINDVAAEWSRFNGVIVYRPRSGMPLPQQVNSTSANNGITDLLNIQMKLMEDISGVNGALQGRLESGSVSGTLYNQQTQNSLISLTDLMKTFNSFVTDATKMDISNIRQYYDSEQIRRIVGRDIVFVDNFRKRGNFRGDVSDFEVRC